MPTVLSVQSWVACGNVGNTAALFPLQRLGCETWSLNTVAFSNHTGYEKWRGNTVPASEIATLFEGIAELGVLPRCDAVLSGYLGEAETGPVLLDIVARVKKANPSALFCCDPVMGDIGLGYYVRAGIPEFYRDRALALADIVTPNRFELEWLTGAPVRSLAEAAFAAEGLRQRGPSIVLATSLETAADRIATIAAGPDGLWAVETPRLPIEATGCGDAVAALFLGWLLKGKSTGICAAALACTSHKFEGRRAEKRSAFRRFPFSTPPVGSEHRRCRLREPAMAECAALFRPTLLNRLLV
jgi:pyridoxine kinase